MNGRNAERWSTRPRLPLDWSDESVPTPRRASPTRVTEDLSQVYEDVSQRTEPSDRTWRRDPVRASRFRRRETEERRHYLNAPRLRHHGDSRDAKSPRRRALSPDIFTRPESLEEPTRSNFVLPELLIADDLDDVTSGSSDDEDEVISRLSSAGSFARGRPSTHHARSRSAKSSLQHEVGETGGRYNERAYRHRRISTWNYPSADKEEPSTGQGRGRRNAVERKERLARILNSYASDSESDSEDFGHVMSLLRPSKSHHRSASHEFCDDDADRATHGRGRNRRHRRALTSVQDLLASLAESGDYREVY